MTMNITIDTTGIGCHQKIISLSSNLFFDDNSLMTFFEIDDFDDKLLTLETHTNTIIH